MGRGPDMRSVRVFISLVLITAFALATASCGMAGESKETQKKFSKEEFYSTGYYVIAGKSPDWADEKEIRLKYYHESGVDAVSIAYIKAVLEDDMENMQAQGSVSLMAKWLPSVNASSKETVRIAKKIARAMNMSDASYRKMLSSLRAYIKILENNLRTKDYSFEYEKQPSKAIFKYRKAFIRNDEERYSAFIEKAKADPSVLKTSTLTPYDIVSKIIRLRRSTYGFKPGYAEMSQEERSVLDATWNALENYVNSDDTLAVVDGSGSMYGGRGVLPAAVAESLP